MKSTLAALFLLLSVVCLPATAGSLSDIRQALEQSSVAQVQEKVYVHTDNTCYFVGDTLWFKAYVVRADNLQPTDMSRILYVELLSPDGLLVERQNIIVSPTGYTCGQFCLRDSLYSGYYELRAYTRWMLNFNQTEHWYARHETWLFFNRKMAADYYRMWDGLYSRVLPIYSKPEEPGNYDSRRMYQRPKQRLQKPRKDELFVSFYPEGGSLVSGQQSRVAFEVEDQNGEAVAISGQLTDGTSKVADIATTHQGRGLFNVTPGSKRLKATFAWKGKTYSFALPKAEEQGVVMRLDGNSLSLSGNMPAGGRYGLSVLCRGVLRHFEELTLPATVTLPIDKLPTGVNDVTLFDADGHILADRLFFVGADRVDNHGNVAVVDGKGLNTRTFEPYQPVDLQLQLPLPNTTFSIAVRDSRTDEPTYNDGNVMTDLLLSSELRGFIAHPAYYFESNDDTHRRHLDLLMMVQGWRKYKWQELADTTRQLAYEPEKTMTVSGAVYKMLGINDVELEEVTSWQNGVGRVGTRKLETDEGTTDVAADDGLVSTEDIGRSDFDVTDNSTIAYGSLNNANDELGIDHGSLRREVLVEAELIMGDEIVAAVQKTQNGRFVFEIPPFYGATFFNMKAYKERDSVKKAMLSRSDATMFREDAFADYFVKRDMPYPVFTRKYSFYENHAPEWEVTIDEDSLSELSMENDVHQLRNVDVKGRRRGKRAIDWQKPAYVCDAYDMYNTITDYGLSFGKYDMRQFPQQVAKFLYGNMGRYNRFNVDGRLNGQTYWRNYTDIIDMGSAASDELQMSAKRLNNRSAAAIYNNLKLARLKGIRVFSDYEPRNEDSTLVESYYSADATVEMVPIDNDGVQTVFRDRHIYLYGFSEPATFYQPDYSRRQPQQPADYRRTLYWNPNAKSDEQGRYSLHFFNNGKETRIRLSAAGITPDGQFVFTQ